LEEALSDIGENIMNCKTSILDESFGQSLAAVPPQIALQLQALINQAIAPLLDQIASLREENATLVDRLTALEGLSATPAEIVTEEVHLPQQVHPAPGNELLDEILQLRVDLEATTARQDHSISMQAEKLYELEAATPATGPAPGWTTQPKQLRDREILLLVLSSTTNGKMLQSKAREKMGISKSAFSRLLRTLKGRVKKEPYHRDRRQNVLILINKKS